MGAYHTLDLEVNRKFTIRKHFDSVDLDRIDSCCDPTEVRGLRKGTALKTQFGLIFGNFYISESRCSCNNYARRTCSCMPCFI